MKPDVKKLLSNLSCSYCRNSFDEESLLIEKKETGVFSAKLVCQKCGKDFGLCFLGISKDSKNEPLEIQEGMDKINYDDVIDAHKFIKNMDKNWQNYLPKDE